MAHFPAYFIAEISLQWQYTANKTEKRKEGERAGEIERLRERSTAEETENKKEDRK